MCFCSSSYRGFPLFLKLLAPAVLQSPPPYAAVFFSLAAFAVCGTCLYLAWLIIAVKLLLIAVERDNPAEKKKGVSEGSY